MARYDQIICGVTTGSASSSFLNTLGESSEISIKRVSGSSVIVSEVGFSREGSIVFSDEDNLYYQLTSGSWISYTDLPTTATTYTKTQADTTFASLGKIFYNVESISIDKALGDSDCVILVSGSPTISLPTAIGITGKGISY